MYHVYVLRSQKSLKRYVGITSQSPDEKLKEHNSGATAWTRANRPFQLIYFEDFDNKTIALKRERFFKTGNGRKVLDKLIKV